MKKSIAMIASTALSVLLTNANAWQSAVANFGTDNRLAYQRDAEGNSIADFSWAGYEYGEVEPPYVPVVATLTCDTGDQTARIQHMIDSVSTLPAGSDGIVGAILLKKGMWKFGLPIYDTTSGVVIRGEGNDTDGTVLFATGDSTAQKSAICLGGRKADVYYGKGKGNDTVSITNDTVYVGARSFAVRSAAAYSVGDTIVVFHPCSQAWINAVNGGDTITPWTVGQVPLCYIRKVMAISGDSITIDAPVYNTLIRAQSPSYVYHFSRPGTKHHIGIENLRFDNQTAAGNDTDENHTWDAIDMKGIDDGWVRGCTMIHFAQSGVMLSAATRVTVDSCNAIDPISIITGERRYNFNCYSGAQMILFKNCFTRHSRHAFVSNGCGYVSDMVVWNCHSDSAHTSSEGHRQWTTGMLFDNYVYDAGYQPDDNRVLGFYNRSGWGTQHGWASAHCVAWNCRVPTDAVRIVIMKPPSAQNWAIGCSAFAVNNEGVIRSGATMSGACGYVEGTNTAGVEPSSLYAEQLAERMAVSSVVKPSVISSSQSAPKIYMDKNSLVASFSHGVNGPVSASIITVDGKIAWRGSSIATGGNEVAFVNAKLADGIYIVRVKASSGSVDGLKLSVIKK